MSVQTLREIVAKIARVDPASIDSQFSLETMVFASSIKKAALIASIRRYMGIDCMEAALAKNFGELEAMLQGGAKPAGAQPAPLQAPQPPPADGMSIGVDLEFAEELPATEDFSGHEFYQENFTQDEIAYCASQPEPRLHFAARWCAKEALRKCDTAFAAVPANAVEVSRENSGAVFLRRLGPDGALRLPHALSLSHAKGAAIAFVALPPRPARAGAWAVVLSASALAVALIAALR